MAIPKGDREPKGLGMTRMWLPIRVDWRSFAVPTFFGRLIESPETRNALFRKFGNVGSRGQAVRAPWSLFGSVAGYAFGVSV